MGEQLAAARARPGTLAIARLAAGDVPGGSLAARRAMRPLRLLERTAWEAAMTGLDSPVASPATALFATLPWHWALADRLAASRPGPNRLPGGDFENFALMLQSGWRHFQCPLEGVQTAADLVPEAAHGGRLGLRLTARADDPENPPAMLETPPLWITTPAVPLTAGQVVVIHGWVNIPKAITGSVDGLLVFDSLTGEDLALRIDKHRRLAGIHHVPRRRAIRADERYLRPQRPGRGPPGRRKPGRNGARPRRRPGHARPVLARPPRAMNSSPPRSGASSRTPNGVPGRG